MSFLSEKFLQQYPNINPNIKKYLELRKNNQESVTEIFEEEEKEMLNLAESYSEYTAHMRKFLYENNSANGKDYLDYALDLHRDFEKEKQKNEFSN
jgi:hypothetical protein